MQIVQFYQYSKLKGSLMTHDSIKEKRKEQQPTPLFQKTAVNMKNEWNRIEPLQEYF